MNPTSLNRPNLPSFPELWGFDSSLAFLNHGSFGACPLPVLDYQCQIRRELESQSMEFLLRRSQPLIDRSREILCELVGADPRDLVFVGNATAGVNAVLRSLAFQPDDEILTTAHDYNACRNVANYVAGRSGAKVIEVPLPLPIASPDVVVEAVLSRVTARTKLVMLDHITSPTAIVFPVEEITRRLAERNIDVLIDGAHAPGMVPLDLRRLDAAYYTGNCHKWLCAPKAAGFLYVRPDRQEGIMPPIIGHGYNKPRPGYTRFQDLFDWPGTFDPTPWICVGRAIEFLSGLMTGGLPALMQRNNALSLYARRLLLDRLCRTGFQPVNSRTGFQTVNSRTGFQTVAVDSRTGFQTVAVDSRTGFQTVASSPVFQPVDSRTGFQTVNSIPGFQPVTEKPPSQPLENSPQAENQPNDSKNPICPESMLGSMAAIILPGDIGDRLDETTSPTPTHWLYGELRAKHRLEAVMYHFPAPPQAILRVSAQAYNTPEQYERLAEAMKQYI